MNCDNTFFSNKIKIPYCAEFWWDELPTNKLTAWSCGLMRHVFDWEVEGSNLGEGIIYLFIINFPYSWMDP